MMEWPSITILEGLRFLNIILKLILTLYSILNLAFRLPFINMYETKAL